MKGIADPFPPPQIPFSIFLLNINTEQRHGLILPPIQTWKKLQVVQAVLADILSEIQQILGHFQLNIIYFWLRIEEEEVRIEI